MPQRERQQVVLELLKEMGSSITSPASRYDKFCRLVWTELNYQRVNQPLPRRGWTDTAAKTLAEDPVLFAGGEANWSRWTKQSKDLAAQRLRSEPVDPRL
jgi:hypothetical protein